MSLLRRKKGQKAREGDPVVFPSLTFAFSFLQMLQRKSSASKFSMKNVKDIMYVSRAYG